MSKLAVGLIFVVAGLLYGSLAVDSVNSVTIGYLVKNHWLKMPNLKSAGPFFLGSKGSIFVAAAVLIILGIFILWK